MTATDCECPFCKGVIELRPARLRLAECPLCGRPLGFARVTQNRAFVASLLDLAKVGMLPLVGGVTAAFALAYIDPHSYAAWVAAALLAWGMIDVWDGTAGLRTHVDRDPSGVLLEVEARWRSIAKTVFGVTSTVLGGAGLMVVG
jgi:hypothetical protein